MGILPVNVTGLWVQYKVVVYVSLVELHIKREPVLLLLLGKWETIQLLAVTK